MRENNWPPLPFFCPIKPCFYQNFAVEIPADYQRICKMLYYLWMRESLLPSELKGDAGSGSGALSVLWLLFLPDSSLLQCWAGLGPPAANVVGPLQSAPCPRNPPVGWD